MHRTIQKQRLNCGQPFIFLLPTSNNVSWEIKNVQNEALQMALKLHHHLSPLAMLPRACDTGNPSVPLGGRWAIQKCEKQMNTWNLSLFMLDQGWAAWVLKRTDMAPKYFCTASKKRDAFPPYCGLGKRWAILYHNGFNTIKMKRNFKNPYQNTWLISIYTIPPLCNAPSPIVAFNIQKVSHAYLVATTQCTNGYLYYNGILVTGQHVTSAFYILDWQFV